jgi:alkanesulfonate monooxygenase SsuD/methylene tetrahydromethanopterin reductase-like flavin-dependent oxidoreductase (luciferase family)
MKNGLARLVDGMTIELGRIGIWRHPSGLTPDLAAEVEALGYGAIWVGGSPAGDLGVVENLLATTDHIAVATGIVNVWKDDATTVAASYHRITARHPGRFLLGLGIGHPEATTQYQRPYAKLVSYLDELDELEVPAEGRALAALGRPRVQNPYLGLTNYVSNLRRLGWADADLADGGSDALIDALVVHGDAETLGRGVTAHLDAGADHVAVQFLESDPLPALRALAASLDLVSS